MLCIWNAFGCVLLEIKLLLLLKDVYQHIVSLPNLLPLCRWHFQMHFSEWIAIFFLSKFHLPLLRKFPWQHAIIVLCDACRPTRSYEPVLTNNAVTGPHSARASPWTKKYLVGYFIKWRINTIISVGLSRQSVPRTYRNVTSSAHPQARTQLDIQYIGLKSVPLYQNDVIRALRRFQSQAKLTLN